jgi:hypothetical protein
MTRAALQTAIEEHKLSGKLLAALAEGKTIQVFDDDEWIDLELQDVDLEDLLCAPYNYYVVK